MTSTQYQALYDAVPKVFPLPVPARPTSASPGVGTNASAGTSSFGVQANASSEGSAQSSVPLGPAAPAAEPGQVPCRDARGCPDLVVDPAKLLVGVTETRTFPSADCSVQENSTSAGTRHLLRFTFTTPNIGDGDLIIGDPEVHPEWFQWGTCHGHWHFRQYAAYRLWTVQGYLEWRHLRHEQPDAKPDDLLAAHPGLRAQFVGGHKQGFCAEDVQVYLPIQLAHYQSCLGNQGISRGWADEYQYQLDGQWVDVTGLPAGPYMLEAEVNPAHLYQEMDYVNNSAAVLVLVQP
jgi:hypothetical protein